MMILNVSGRTDIVAFYTEWFMNRYRAGFVDVRNPFNPHLVSRINFQNVDAILFCTKNPWPILDYLEEIKKPIIFHVTLTPYQKDIEPNVGDKTHIIVGIKKLSQIIGIDNLYIRYDPILLNEKYNVAYHQKAFARLCQLLDGYVKHFIVSFIDDYKNVRRHAQTLALKPFQEADLEGIGRSFIQTAQKYGMSVQTCFEDRTLEEYGFKVGECLSAEMAYRLTGKKYPRWKARTGQKCQCVQMVDIGVYNTCPHFCHYCYANYDEKMVKLNHDLHDPQSSLLIGYINSDDVIKERIK